MTLYLYLISEHHDSAHGAISVIAHSEQNAQEQILHHVKHHPLGVGMRDNEMHFYTHEPRREYANRYRFPWVLKERFAISGFLAQRVVLFTYSRG